MRYRYEWAEDSHQSCSGPSLHYIGKVGETNSPDVGAKNVASSTDCRQSAFRGIFVQGNAEIDVRGDSITDPLGGDVCMSFAEQVISCQTTAAVCEAA
jgi:hypothetical protein